MTFVPTTPPGPISGNTPLVFTCAEPLNINVQFYPVDAAGNAIPGAWDVVYGGTDNTGKNGSVAPRYTGCVDRNGNTWTVRPPGGTWPCPVRVWADEGGAGGPKGKLQSDTEDHAARAMWAIDAPPVADSPYPYFPDRSVHNERFILTGGGGYFPAPDDLIPGTRSVLTWASPSHIAENGPSGLRGGAPSPGLVLPGEVSLTMRVFRNYGGGSQNQYMLSFGEFDNPSEPGNVQYSLVLGGPSFNHLVYFAQTGPSKAAIIYVSAVTVPTGVWSFPSLRRAANGAVTIGCNGVFETSGPLPLPTGGSAGRPHIGRALNSGYGGGNGGFMGYMKDCCIWGRRLTDAELADRELESLGAA